MKKILMLCALCALVSPAMAGSLIDEDFSSVSFQQQMVPIGTVSVPGADQWWTSATSGINHWQVVGGVAQVQQVMVSPETSALWYFTAKPGSGWGGNELEMSFLQRVPFNTEGSPVSHYGLYGWSEGASLDITNPAAGGMELAAGDLPLSPTYTLILEGYTGDLSGFDYIGVVFRQSVTLPGQCETDVEFIQLNVVPEPMAVSLLALGGMGLLRRRKKA